MPKIPVIDVENIDTPQPPPFSIQVELTEGCNLRCSFCGLNGIRGKENNYKFATTDTILNIARQIRDLKWNSRVEFAMHGEPSVHPLMIALLRDFRRIVGSRIHMMMTSNGAGFVKAPNITIDAALESLNVLALDWYENVQLVPKIMDTYQGEYTIRHYPADQSANPHRRRKPGEHDFVVIQDIAKAEKGTHASLNNHAGSGGPPNDNAKGKRCAKPFRELSVRWDGSISICCNSWLGIFKCGNVNEMTMEQIWHGPEMRAARRKLYHGQRDFGDCKGCDALSYRPGLLPDQRGKLSLPLPTKADESVIAKACSGVSYTKPVLRPWDQDEPTSLRVITLNEWENQK